MRADRFSQKYDSIAKRPGFDRFFSGKTGGNALPSQIKNETLIMGWKASAYYRMSFNKIKFESYIAQTVPS